MTLRDKLKTEFPINTELKSKKFANKCVKIADEYAIDFSEWIGVDNGKKLLEIYKKENGL